jgi:uncharacterized protein YdhG (YjbR/CyaY superfamily)
VTVDEYIAAQPQATRAVLRRVRTAIRKALPKAEETIAYNMPAYKLGGHGVLYFAGWKKHYALYYATEALLAELGDALAPYEVDKDTIRFRYDQPVPSALIARIAKLRAAEVRG